MGGFGYDFGEDFGIASARLSETVSADSELNTTLVQLPVTYSQTIQEVTYIGGK